MDLKTYLSDKPRGASAALAEQIGVNRVLVSQWTADVDPRPIPVQHCPAIERVTAGAVTRRDLRPADWHKVWPELVTAEFPAPATPEPAAQGAA